MSTTAYTAKEMAAGEQSLKRAAMLSVLDLPITSVEVSQQDVIKYLDDQTRGVAFNIADYV